MNKVTTTLILTLVLVSLLACSFLPVAKISHNPPVERDEALASWRDIPTMTPAVMNTPQVLDAVGVKGREWTP